jgi:hypothetical protein
VVDSVQRTNKNQSSALLRWNEHLKGEEVQTSKLIIFLNTPVNSNLNYKQLPAEDNQLQIWKEGQNKELQTFLKL